MTSRQVCVTMCSPDSTSEPTLQIMCDRMVQKVKLIFVQFIVTIFYLLIQMSNTKEKTVKCLLASSVEVRLR